MEHDVLSERFANQLFRNLYSTKIGLAISDRCFRYRKINPALAEWHGLSIEAHTGKTVRDVMGGIGKRFERLHERVFSSRCPILGVKVSGRHLKRGNAGQFIVDYFPVENRNGKVTHVFAVVVEVANEKNLERLMAAHREALAGLALRVQGTAALTAGLAQEDEMWTGKPVNPNGSAASGSKAMKVFPGVGAAKDRAGGRNHHTELLAPLTDSGHLSAREREVLKLLAEGKPNKEIAAHFARSVKTIESHRSRIMHKLHAKSLVDLVRYAVRQGMVDI